MDRTEDAETGDFAACNRRDPLYARKMARRIRQPDPGKVVCRSAGQSELQEQEPPGPKGDNVTGGSKKTVGRSL
ncbi:putative double-stranded RNA/RNA-DNA hybrid binding protein [Ceratocystis lukuohia]|uniref:Double-stranded RNA/RNA-DNA hybrid binding protein n=1 Tax=Ceratocystis lukuohia TaxID=2019550 RepID=A0ABR4MGC2_9PEZI